VSLRTEVWGDPGVLRPEIHTYRWGSLGSSLSARSKQFIPGDGSTRCFGPAKWVENGARSKVYVSTEFGIPPLAAARYLDDLCDVS